MTTDTSKEEDPDLPFPASSRRALPSSEPIRIASSNSLELFGEDLVSTTPEPAGNNEDDQNSELVHSDYERSEHAEVGEALASGAHPLPKTSPTSSKLSGRPPRPVVVGAKAGSKSLHKPEKSLGDASFLSALTDPGDVDGLFQPTLNVQPTLERPKNIRNRSVSFGDGVGEGQAPSQPLPRPRPLSNWDKISLADFVSPIETEAETAIFRALESHRRQQSSASEFIFPNIPDDSVHSFEQQDSWEVGATGSYEEKKDYDSVTSCSVQMKTEEPPASPSKKSEASSQRAQSKYTARAKAETSLESTLFGLSAAMRDIHGTTAEASIADSQSNRNRLSSTEFGAAGARNEQKVPVHDQDAFVHNANLVFRRQLNPPEPAPAPAPAPASSQPWTAESKSSWNLFGGQDVADPKKTDIVQKEGDDDVVGIDIEMGDGSERTKIASGKNPKPRPKSFGGQLAQYLLLGTKKIAGAPQEFARQTPQAIKRARFGMKEDLGAFKNFLKPRKQSIKRKAKLFVLYILAPTLLTSTLLFYAFGNPKMSNGCDILNGQTVCPSVSWFLNFLILRQAIAFALGRATQMFFIDYLALKTMVLLRAFGPVATLMIVQSKGWPFQIGASAIYSLILNSGDNKFARHWLFYQKGIDMFNESNPAGSIPGGEWNRLILWTLILLGVAVAVKRFLIGLYLGQRTYAIYGSQLAKVIQQMIIISQLARLGLEFELRMTDPALATSLKLRHTLYDLNRRGFVGTDPVEEDDQTDGDQPPNLVDNKLANNKTGTKGGTDAQDGKDSILTEQRDVFKGSSGRMKVLELLDAWEEPELEPGKEENISISAILQFRQSLAFMDLSYPFSTAFGLADTREHCVESSQGVYRRLMLKTPGTTVLSFDTIATLGSPTPDTVDAARVKDLIRLFRPDREGNLTMLDFVKSVDAVYKKLRQLRASINSSSQIDRATEVMINVFFYFTVFCVILARLKIDPLAFFLSMSSVIIAFAFMIGSASAKYFEGIMFILVRRPYDVGDRISISDPTGDANADGSSTWFVESVDLYTTTVRFATTNEVATLANGSLATARIINAARSPKALVYLKLKFGVDVPYAKVQLFRSIVEAFVKARPREWLSLSGFRASKVEADLGYIEYVISCQHREGWQTVVPILQSKADLFSYCLEVQKQLNMRYITPSVPVDLNIGQRVTSAGAASQASNDEKDESMEPRRRANTSTAVEGIQSLADLFAIR